MQPKVFVASSPERVADVCDAEGRRLLEENFTVKWNRGPELTSDQLAENLDDVDVLLTSWGSPRIPAPVLAAFPRLRVIGHAAGTVKNLLPTDVFDHTDAVFSAAPRIADSVGEYCLAAAMTLLRRLPEFHRHVQNGGWRNTATVRGGEMTGRRIGVVGASSTARAFLRFLAPYDAQVSVYDPYLSEEAAAQLGVRLAPLDEVMGNDLVSVHVPSVPATEGMITAELLARIPTNGIFINSSRAGAIDMPALYEEIASGRIHAALDVFEAEPPTLDPRILAADNVLLSPHVAGDTIQGHLALTGFVVRDILRWLETGETGRAYVNPATWNLSA